MRSVLAALVFAGAMTHALAHSWYPWECCSDRDCFPVEARDVRGVPGGWMLQDGTFIAFREARPSPDQNFHVCRREDGKGALIRLHEKPACFWAPVGAS
jgi:hypothetical protein